MGSYAREDDRGLDLDDDLLDQIGGRGSVVITCKKAVLVLVVLRPTSGIN